MAAEELWEHMGRELVSSQYGREDRKFLAFLSCTRYTGDATEPATHDEVSGFRVVYLGAAVNGHGEK